MGHPRGGVGAWQVAVQVGNLSASLGDRLWATWFSSAAQYARATQPLAAARINVRVRGPPSAATLPASTHERAILLPLKKAAFQSVEHCQRGRQPDCRALHRAGAPRLSMCFMHEHAVETCGSYMHEQAVPRRGCH